MVKHITENQRIKHSKKRGGNFQFVRRYRKSGKSVLVCVCVCPVAKSWVCSLWDRTLSGVI